MYLFPTMKSLNASNIAEKYYITPFLDKIKHVTPTKVPGIRLNTFTEQIYRLINLFSFQMHSFWNNTIYCPNVLTVLNHIHCFGTHFVKYIEIFLSHFVWEPPLSSNDSPFNGWFQPGDQEETGSREVERVGGCSRVVTLFSVRPRYVLGANVRRDCQFVMELNTIIVLYKFSTEYFSFTSVCPSRMPVVNQSFVKTNTSSITFPLL